MSEAGIGNNRHDISNDVEGDVNSREHQSAGLHDRHVALGHVVDQILPHAGIDEDHLHHDDTDDKEGQVEHHHIDDRGNGIGERMAGDINVMDFVEAAKLRGEGRIWIIFREILPNALTPLVAELGLRFIFAVLFLSALSFLGLGVQPPDADWGGMVKENKEGIVFGIPAALIPAAAIAILAISVNLVADWILNRTTSLKGGRGNG